MIYLGNKTISTDNPVYIIAEAGVNHNGNMELAKRLIDVAVAADVDAIKFQTFKTENVISRLAPKAQYQLENTNSNESQFDMVKKLELSNDNFYVLKDYCKLQGIQFLSSPFDEASVDLLERLNVEAFKIGSGEINNLPLLRYIAAKRKPIILSTGMSNLGEIEEALEVIKECDVILLHATSNYPTSVEDVNLLAMKTMETAFNKIVGYSDHTQGFEVAIAAVTLGAKVIEKHFTLDKNLAGPDHKASLDPTELKILVSLIRNVEKCLGNGVKRAMQSEENTRLVARKSIVAKEGIKAGDVLTKEMLAIKRPGNGIPPKFLDQLIGATIKNNVAIDETIQWGHLLFKDEENA